MDLNLLKDIGAVLFGLTLVGLIFIALIIGFKAIFKHIVGYGTYNQNKTELERKNAEYAEQVKQLKMASQATEVVK